MAASILKSTGGGRPKMGHVVRKSPPGIQLGESTRGKEPSRQLATRAVDQKPAKTSGKERGRKLATKATMPAAAKAADRTPTEMRCKEPGRQPATKAADLKPAKMLGKKTGRQPATKAADPKLAETRRRKEAGREPATKAADAKKLAKKRKASGCQELGDAEKLAKKAKKTVPKSSGCQKPGVKVARPTYWVMVKEAISSLKQRRGSSQQALAKYLEENYGEGLPENFRKILSKKLKEWSKADGQLTKVKNSYKLK